MGFSAPCAINMWNIERLNAMKTEVFEKAILQQNLQPVEVKLSKNQVKWFVARDEKTKELVVFDYKGMAYCIDYFDWHGQDLDIKNKNENVTVNGIEAERCPLFRLWD